MASTYSQNLKLQLMTTGENTGTWGNVTNVNLGTALEESIVGTGTVTFASADVTLTLTNSNATQTARNIRLVLSGTSGGARQLVVPALEKVYIVKNDLADACTVKVSGQTGVAVPSGKTMWLYNDGTDVTDVTTYLSNLALGTPLPVSSGGTGSNTGVNVQTAVSGILPVANGGTGSATAAFNGSLITNLNATAIASGTIDNTYTTANASNQANAIVLRDGSGNFAASNLNLNSITLGTALNSAYGGTGVTSPGTSGNVLTSNGSVWVSSAPGLSQMYTSSELAVADVAKYTLAHGLGGLPTLVKVFAVCKSAEYGYAVGEYVDISTVQSTWTSGTAYAVGLATSMDTTYVYITMGATVAFGLIRKDTGGSYLVSTTAQQANWRIVVRAWK